MKKEWMLLLAMPLLTLPSCAGGTSSNEASAPEQQTTNDGWDWDWEDDSDSEEESSVKEERGQQVAIGGDSKAFPTRRWNPGNPLEEQKFIVKEDNSYHYSLTIKLFEGDCVLFFFDYAWLKTLDYSMIDWDYNPAIEGIDSYVSNVAIDPEAEDPSRLEEIYILKDATFTFEYHHLGDVYEDLKSGLVLVSLS